MFSEGYRPDVDFYGKRPAPVADERPQLTGWLDLQRALVRRKLEGLAEADEHRAVLSGSPMMTPAGLVSHMRWTEHCWLNVVFLDEAGVDNPQLRKEPKDADMRVDGVPLARLLGEFEARCAQSNEIAAGHSVDDLGNDPEFTPTLSWILRHMVEETARHVGTWTSCASCSTARRAITAPRDRRSDKVRGSDLPLALRGMSR